MTVIEILERLNEDYELEIDGLKIDFSLIANYVRRLEKNVNDLSEIIKIKNANAEIDRKRIAKLKKRK